MSAVGERPFQAAAARIVRDTTAAQGLPEHLEDPATIARIVVLLDVRPLGQPRSAS